MRDRGRHLANPEQYDRDTSVRVITLCRLDEPSSAIVTKAADIDCPSCAAIVACVCEAIGFTLSEPAPSGAGSL